MNPKIYTADEHGISLEDIDSDALFVMERLRSKGFTAYLVGGSVRDLLLKEKPKDFDISTSALPEEIRQVFRNSILIGRRFRLAHIRFGKKVIEVATFRSGATESDALIVRDNEWGTPEQDVLRRDFTINGLFFDPAEKTVIDYVGGYPDIQKKVLRTIGQAYLRFRQDPVRMIRLIKFQARFGLDIDPEAKLALVDCRSEIIKSSQARILEELLRMLESRAAQPFFRLMTQNGVLQLLLPGLGAFLETEDGEDVYSFLREVDTTFHAPEQMPLDRSVLLSCLLFPLFETHLKVHYLDRDKKPHLGEIFHEARTSTDELFRPFFLLPRKLKVSVVSILTTQYRLTPLEKKKQVRLRAPSDPDFPLALKFLEVRACLEPGLKQTWEAWQEVELPSPDSPPPRRRRRRRR